MINSKKILSLILVVVLCFSTVVVSSLTANGSGDRTLAFKFRDQDYLTGRYDNIPSSVTCGNDGSMTMTSSKIQKQYQMAFKVDGSNKENLKDAIEEACEFYDASLTMEVYVKSAKNAYGGDCSPSIDIQLQNSSGKVIAKTGLNRQSPEQTNVFYSFDVMQFAETGYNYEIAYVYVVVQCYDWACGGGNGTCPEVTFYPITVDDGQTSEQRSYETVPPDPNQVTFFQFTPKTNMPYDNGPSTIRYSSDCASWKTSGRATEADYGYIELKQNNPVEQMQVNYSFVGFEDMAQNAVNIAKADGNSGKVKFRVNLAKCTDPNGKPTIAEISIMMIFQQGITAKAPEMITLAAWQYPGTTRTYYIDVTGISHKSQLNTVAFKVQNYWYYDKDGQLFDYDAMIRKEGGTPDESTAIAAGYSKCRIKPEVVISPMTVAGADEASATNTDYKLVLDNFNANGGTVPTDPEELKKGDPNATTQIYEDVTTASIPSSSNPSQSQSNSSSATNVTVPSSNNPSVPSTGNGQTTVLVPTTNNPKNIVGAPTLNSAVPTGKSSVKLDWSAAGNAQKYQIYRAKGSSSSFQLIGTTTGLTYTDNIAKGSAKYSYKVRAINGTAYNDSLIKSVSMMSFSAKSTAKLTKASKAITVKLKKKVAYADGYQIKYSTNKKFKKSATKAKVLKASKKSLKIKKLQSGKKYYVRIRAYKIINGKKVYGKWSKVYNTTTK